LITVGVELQKAHLKSIEHAALQEKIRTESKRKRTSRRSIQRGGPASKVNDLREKIRIRNEQENGEALRKARKRLSQACNKAKAELKAQGVQARKDEKARKERLKEYVSSETFPPIKDLLVIREPDKAPTTQETLRCTEEGYPELLHIVRQLEREVYQGDIDDTNITIKVGDSQEQEEVPPTQYLDSSPPPPNLVDSSDIDSDVGSIDSIQNNADFIGF